MKPIDVAAAESLATIAIWRDETDRGAAVLAGSMVENALGQFLSRYCSAHADKDTVKRLFNSTGPINSFGQRILVARAFGLIDNKRHKQLELIKDIRNHFAHHPLNAAFEDEHVRVLAKQIDFNSLLALDPETQRRGVLKTCYLVACAHHSAKLMGLGKDLELHPSTTVDGQEANTSASISEPTNAPDAK